MYLGFLNTDVLICTRDFELEIMIPYSSSFLILIKTSFEVLIGPKLVDIISWQYPCSTKNGRCTSFPDLAFFFATVSTFQPSEMFHLYPILSFLVFHVIRQRYYAISSGLIMYTESRHYNLDANFNLTKGYLHAHLLKICMSSSSARSFLLWIQLLRSIRVPQLKISTVLCHVLYKS